MYDYSQICDNYSNGMCIYINSKHAIFQPCICEKIAEEFKVQQMQNCNLKKAIEIMKKKDLEEKAGS